MKFLLFTILLSNFLLLAQPEQFRFRSYVPNGTVNTIVSDNAYTYVGGNFNAVALNQANVFKASTSSPFSENNFPTFSDNDPYTSSISKIIYDPGYGWFIAGSGFKVDAKSMGDLVHIYNNGVLDTTFKITQSGLIENLKIHNNHLYVMGSFISIQNKNIKYCARINLSNKEIDTNWNVNANGSINDIAFLSNSAFVTGDFTTIQAVPISKIAKVSLSNGSIDANWDADCPGTINSILVHNQNLYVGGTFNAIGGEMRVNLARLDTINANAVAKWNPTGIRSVSKILPADSNLIIIGSPYQEPWVSAYCALVNTQNAQCTQDYLSLYVTPFGTVSVATIFGDHLYFGGDRNTGFGRCNWKTRIVDNYWRPAGSLQSMDGYYTCAVSDSSICVGGRLHYAFERRLGGLVRYSNNDGTLDTSWHPINLTGITKLAVHQNYLYFAAPFSYSSTYTIRNIGRISLTDGKLDTNWAYDCNNNVNTFDFADGFVYVGGDFTSINGVPVSRAARLSLSSRNVDASWNPNVNAQVRSLKVSSGGIYIGGDFNSAGNRTRNFAAKLNKTNGAAITSWKPIFNNSVYSIIEYENSLIFSGDFTTIDNITKNRVAKIDTSTGTLDQNWTIDANGTVNEIIRTNSSLYLCGSFNTINGQNRKYISKANIVNGNLFSDWIPNPNGPLNSILYNGVDLIIGGTFDYLNSLNCNNLAFFTDGTLPVELASFNATQQNSGDVNLSWTTITETKNYGFEIQKRFRITDAYTDWEKILFIPGAGNSNAPKTYSAIDKKSNYPNLQWTEYRLKQIDFNGSFSFSEIASIKPALRKKSFSVQCYPNPFSNYTTVAYFLPQAANVKIEIYNTLGEKITSIDEGNKSAGEYKKEISLPRASAGIYFCRLIAGKETKTVKLLSQ